MYCDQRSQYIRPKSKKNSFRGNYMRKYGNLKNFTLHKIKSPLHVYWFHRCLPTSPFFSASTFSDLTIFASPPRLFQPPWLLEGWEYAKSLRDRFNICWPILTYLPCPTIFTIQYCGTFLNPLTYPKIGRHLWTFPKSNFYCAFFDLRKPRI